MSIKEIGEAIAKDKIAFGIKQILKTKIKNPKVFVAKDARAETFEKLKQKKIKFEESKSKSEISRELNLDFESEVFLLR